MFPTAFDGLGILLALAAAIAPLTGAWWLLGSSGGASRSSNKQDRP